MKETTPAEFIKRMNDSQAITLLDVREEWELGIAKLEMAVHIPMDQVPDRLTDLASDSEIVVMCRSGGRSRQVADFLQRNGYTNVSNLTGGILAWAEQIDNDLSIY